MNIYRRIVRLLFSLVFLAGGAVHVVAGQLHPEGYAPYGNTAWFPGLRELWHGFVMPNIGWLTLILAVFELLIGAGLLLGNRATRIATLAALGFFGFLLLLGYGWHASSMLENVAKNFANTFVMIALITPVLLGDNPPIVRRKKAAPSHLEERSFSA